MTRLGLLALFFAGCYSPDLPDGELRCSADRTCPGGFHCAGDDTCWHDGADPDLAIPDAGRDGPLDATSDAPRDAAPGLDGARDGAVDAAPDQAPPDGGQPDQLVGDGGHD